MRAFYKSFMELRRAKPQRIVSMGGYISIPVCLAAWLLRIPIDLFELNAEPGKAIRWLTPLAHRVLTCFEEAQNYFPPEKVQSSPYPLRFTQADIIERETACKKLDLDPTKKILLVLGGSQGSQSLNKLIPALGKQYPHICIIHQAGPEAARLKEWYRQEKIDARVFEYLHELQYPYCAADLVIARSGTGTLFELLFFQKKALLVPLEVASTDHQVANAYAFARKRPDLFTVVRNNWSSAIEQALK